MTRVSARPSVWLFGAVTVGSGDHRTSAGGPRQSAVLSVLALSVGRPVDVGRLTTAVWGEDPPPTATNGLQVYVSALRKLLRASGQEITRVGGTYTLAAALDDVDVEVFHRHAGEGHSALRALEPERALVALQRAWDLWDPTPFAGLDDCAFVGPARAALLSAGLGVAADRGAALCAVGRSADAAALAEQLVESHPFHEPAWELLMQALYYSGRQHDALLAFGRARSTFVEELGLDPPATLVELERQILDRSLEPVATRPQVAAPSAELASAAAPRLPQPARGIVGRSAEIERVLELASKGTRLITLTGLGGIGKTTAALAAGHRLASSGRAVVFADLAAAGTATTAMERMCEAASVGAGADAAASLAQADPDLVLIADNGEQIADFPRAMSALVIGSTRLTLIVTSRVALRIRAEHVVPLRPLETSAATGPSDAGLLFIERASRLRDDLDLTGDEAAISQICALTGGIPLAIEVAARRLGHLTPATLLERLRRQSAALLDAKGAADLPDRQHSLRTVLDATSTLLSDRAAILARRLCVLKGPISLGLMEEAFADETDLVDQLDELVDASLAHGPDHADRYRMPLPISEYFAEGHAGQAGDREQILSAVLAIAEPLISQVDQRGRWAESRLLDDAAAVAVACEAAIAQRDAHAGTRLALALRRYWLLSSRLAEAQSFCGAILEIGPEDSDRACLQLVYGQFAAMVNRRDAAELLSVGIALAEQSTSGVPALLLVNSWCYLGSWQSDHGELDGARQAARRVEELAVASADPEAIELSRDFGAYVATRVGDFATAARLGAELLVDARRRGDRYVVIDLLYRVAENLLVLGRHAEADQLMNEAMEVAGTTSIGPLAARVIAVRAAVDIEHGRLSGAIGAALEGLRLTATLYPDPVTQASLLRVLGAAWASAGDVETAARCDGAATAILQRAGAPIESAFLAPVELHLEGIRRDPTMQSAARLAAMDPEAVVDELLGRSSAHAPMAGA